MQIPYGATALPAKVHTYLLGTRILSALHIIIIFTDRASFLTQNWRKEFKKSDGYGQSFFYFAGYTLMKAFPLGGQFDRIERFFLDSNNTVWIYSALQ